MGEVHRSYLPAAIESLLNLKFKNKTLNLAETQVNLMLHGLFVNSLSKTKKESFKQIKEEVQPLVDALKKTFEEFDKNEIHNNMTFIYQLRSPNRRGHDFYILDGRDFIRIYHRYCGNRNINDVRGMYITTEDQKRINEESKSSKDKDSDSVSYSDEDENTED